MGIGASIACAIHCALLPLVVSSLPIFGIDIIENDFFEYGMIVLAMAIGFYSLYHGWKSHHHEKRPLVIFAIGMLFLFAKQYWHHLQIWFLVPAVVIIVYAHYLNYRLCRVHNHAHEDDCDH